MAHATLTMTALGYPHETCAACDRNFARGELMTAFEADDGEPLGWICQQCIDDWTRDGDDSKTAAALFGE